MNGWTKLGWFLVTIAMVNIMVVISVAWYDALSVERLDSSWEGVAVLHMMFGIIAMFGGVVMILENHGRRR